MMQLWYMARGNGFSAGVLPEAGGVGDQAAIMMDAFSVMNAAWAELEPKRAQ